ncbi:anti-sigma factor antagonist [Planobispora takensis]|uniref:Anti-sigma factor antagonist n=2 Tax=Planobispora takensis TaxID=1367882 RepID=A0A8J3WQQ8_9ACTN|nr:anti-sigma factor antagonist [Planobispora takensis]
MGFEVVLGSYGKCAVVHLKGALDLATASALRVMIEHLWDFLQEGCLVLHLSSMTFCDSTGIGAMIGVSNGCGERGVRLVLAEAPVMLRRRLTITGLLPLFEMHDSLEGALSDVGWQPEGAGRVSPFAIEA